MTDKADPLTEILGPPVKRYSVQLRDPKTGLPNGKHMIVGEVTMQKVREIAK